MPVNPTYPGVYIQEIPSGVRTITGVATSISAFIGRATKGPTDTDPDPQKRATTVNSYADFERTYGGLMEGSGLGYTVQDFFLNGGSQAVIIRIYHEDTTATLPAKTSFFLKDASTTNDTEIKLVAASPGSWGQYLRASIKPGTSDDIARSLGLSSKADLFNLTVRDVSPGGAIEQYQNLSVKNSSRRVDKILQSQSALVRWAGDNLDASSPPNIALPASNNSFDDPVTVAESTLEHALRAVPRDETTVNTDRQTLENAKTALRASDGLALVVNDFIGVGKDTAKAGLYALETVDLFNILVLPPYSAEDVDPQLFSIAASYCETRRAMLLVDSPKAWTTKANAKDNIATFRAYPIYYPKPLKLRDEKG